MRDKALANYHHREANQFPFLRSSGRVWPSAEPQGWSRGAQLSSEPGNSLLPLKPAAEQHSSFALKGKAFRCWIPTKTTFSPEVKL